MDRKLIIAGNWKMNHAGAAARRVLQALTAKILGIDEIDVVICPPFTSLAVAVDTVRGSAVAIGAQNVHWDNSGAFTGEISAPMLLECGVTYAIIGHSERRQLFSETDADINRRLRAALRAGLVPILCVGETLEQRQGERTEAVVAEQLRVAMTDLSKEEMQSTIIAYEPVWAIGTGVNATPGQAQEVHAFIRSQIATAFDAATAQIVRIQYGGSVKSGNAYELMAEPDIDGALVGGASLDPDEFSLLIHNARH